jgi:hypothetical protein
MKERKAIVTQFPVGNGDMTLIRLADDSRTAILIDCSIRLAADDPDDATRDVATDLRDRVCRDVKGRPYVDAFLLSHSDLDHCRGFLKHFYVGPPEDYPDDAKKDAEKRIFIREIWSSPMVFRRASKLNPLCEEAIAFSSEAKRRVKMNREKNFSGIEDGDRILVFGEDESGKTDDLIGIVVKTDEVFSRVNGKHNLFFDARLLAPMPKSDEDEELLSRNHSSVILNIGLRTAVGGKTKQFLCGGDAEVAIWERLWTKHSQNASVLQYDLLIPPHHCSWHSLSYDSWSEKGDKAVVSKSARQALSQIGNAGKIVASSCPIKDDDCDPPCYGAKREYLKIVDGAGGKFYCTDEYPTASSPAPIELEVTESGFEELGAKKTQTGAPAILTSGIVDALGARAAENAAVKKEGTRRYA